MIVRETIQQDINYMADHSISRGVFKYQPKQTEFVYTLEHENKVLGVGGIRLINSTTGWCWIDISVEIKNHLQIFYRVVKEWMLELVEEKGIKRLQAYIEPDFEEAIRMAQHLGFEKESILENFLPDGRNALMYRRLF